MRAQALDELSTPLWVPAVLSLREAEAAAPGPGEDGLAGVQRHRIPALVLRGREFQ